MEQSEGPGSPTFPIPRTVGSTRDDLDVAARVVASAAPRWSSTDRATRVALLDRLLHDCGQVAPEWLARSGEGKGVLAEPDALGQEWVSGPYTTLRYIRGLRDALARIPRSGASEPRAAGVRFDGRRIVRALPQNGYDRLFFTGLSADVVMQPEGKVPVTTVSSAEALGSADGAGSVLVLGAGNVSAMGPVDSLFHIFGRSRTVLLKMNPINSYMHDVLLRAFRALVEEGVLQIVSGGPADGAYLCDHRLIDEIHLTGSDKTFDAIVFGSGEAGAARKASGDRLRSKPVTAELGGVGPAIVAPGRWTKRELVQGAEIIATVAFDGGGYSCGAIDLIVLPRDWPQLDDFVEAFRSALDRMPLRPAYYPGAQERYEAFVSSHENVEFHGVPDHDRPLWAFIRGLDSSLDDEMCFRREPFCAVAAETTLDSRDPELYLDTAVRFVNERVWGTLGVALLVPASVRRDPASSRSVERAIAGLRYGTIALNYHPSAAWVSGVTPWGGYQSPDIDSAESGIGFTQNSMMLQGTEKTVLRAPLGGPAPPPVWLMGRGAAMCETFARMCRFEVNRSVTAVPGIVKAGLGFVAGPRGV